MLNCTGRVIVQLILAVFLTGCTNGFVQYKSTSFSKISCEATVEKTESEWREQLSPEAYYVLREEGTERPWTSPLNDVKDDGTFSCAGCGAPLFTASTKYESGSGWPSFYAPVDENAVDLKVDFKLITPRTEVVCKNCGGHLGHVFDDGPRPTGKRYCMNGVALSFVRDDEDPDLAEKVAKRAAVSKPVKQPLAAALPGIAFNGAIAALFLNQFQGNLESGYATGNLVDTLVYYLPLVIGGSYAALTLVNVAEQVMSNQDD